MRVHDTYYHQSTNAAAPPGMWEVLGSVPAQQADQYIYLAPTLADSADTLIYTTYYVSAHTTTPSIFFDSPPDSGYSVDNIAPGVPQGFLLTYNTGSGNQLVWDDAPEPDFQYYKVYRDTDPNFIHGSGNFVDVENPILFVITEAHQLPQRLLLGLGERQLLLRAHHGFPGEIVIVFQHGDEVFDDLLQIAFWPQVPSLK